MVQGVKKWLKVGDNMFMGEYHHSIDNKGRLTIPSKFRLDLDDSFIITRGLDGCLFLYTKPTFNNIINKYKSLNDTKYKRQFMRIFLSGASTIEIDKMGRINIPSNLIEYATLVKDCIIIGVDDRIEIWSEQNWKEFISSNEDNLSEIADNLFNNNYE